MVCAIFWVESGSVFPRVRIHGLNRATRNGEQGATPSWLPIHSSLVPFVCGSLSGVIKYFTWTIVPWLTHIAGDLMGPHLPTRRVSGPHSRQSTDGADLALQGENQSAATRTGGRAIPRRVGDPSPARPRCVLVILPFIFCLLTYARPRPGCAETDTGGLRADLPGARGERVAEHHDARATLDVLRSCWKLHRPAPAAAGGRISDLDETVIKLL